MSFRNIKKMKYLALFVAVLAVGAISSGDANAASTFDTYTDGDGVVWDRETTDDGDIYIGIQSVPSGVTTVTVPAIGDVASGKDTYFLDAVCSRITDCSGVISDTATVTVLDMTNASKIQIRNVSQMFNATHEVELIFGENVVIADPADIGDIADSNTSDTASTAAYWHINASWSDSTPTGTINPYANYAGAFEGMHVKLTNLSNVKYIGWNAFQDTVLNANSKAIAINNNQTIGGYAFAGSDITSLSIDVDVPHGIATDCTNLASLTIGDNVTTIYGGAFKGATSLTAFNSGNVVTIYGDAFNGSGITTAEFEPAIKVIGYAAFKDTNISSLDLDGTSIDQIRPYAFSGAHIATLDLGDIKSIGNHAFENNLMEEVYLPKTFRDTYADMDNNGREIFENSPVKKVTIAYDMATTNHQPGLIMQYVIGPSTWNSVDEVVLIAPYAADEQVATDHDYTTARVGQGKFADSALLDTYAMNAKNIIPWDALGNSGYNSKLRKFIIDDRYEVFGTLAFSYQQMSEIHTIDANGNISEDMRLPANLKAIGANAFQFVFDSWYTPQGARSTVTIDTLPSGLGYIGGEAFDYNNNLIINTFNLPNLEFIGGGAFYYTNVIDITLSVAPAQSMVGLFAGSHLVKNVTIDYDMFGSNGSDGYNRTFQSLVPWIVNGYIEPGTHSTISTDNRAHFEKIKFTSKATTAPNTSPLNFMGMVADEVDLSETPWTTLYTPDYPGDSYTGIFIGSKIGTVKLPHALETIIANSFIGTEVTEPLVIPDTVTEIGSQAFNATFPDQWRYWYAHAEPGVNITSLPTSIQKIGVGAFIGDALFTADVNLPNLTELGFSAFQGTNVRDVTLGSSITKLGPNAFYDTPSLRNVTIDTDLYNVTRAYEEGSYTYCFDQNGDSCDADTAEGQAARDANYYDSFVATFGTPDHEYGTITFTENAGQPCEGHYNCSKDRAYFYGLKADKVDLSATNWQSTGESMFQESEIGELILPSGLVNIANDTFYQVTLGDVTIPSTLKFIQQEAFQWATANIDGLPEGLILINSSAFYGADVTDNLVIPSTVQNIGQDAFNAGDEDVHYDTITIKPSLSSSQTNNQLIFQIFWNVDVDKMTIASFSLPAGTSIPEGETKPEFHGMPMEEVVITNLPVITKEAFEDCVNLKKVDLSSDANLRVIDKKAFVNDAELDTILFSPDIKNIDVTIGQYAFEGTAFKTMGDSTKQFDLTAAKFDASDGFAFSKMPLLETVDVPATFSNLTVPEATFANDPELRLVTIDYHLDTIDNAAFSNDNKLESIFIWGDTQVIDENIAGRGGDGDGIGGAGGSGPQAVGPEYGPTIPEPTDIYAYSTSRAEEYAALPVRGTFEGDFYPLDEVLYLTSNKPTVLLNDDETDFDKSDLVVYAMRRDGVILESDEWSTYDGNAYPRSTSSVDFEHMAEKIQEDPVFGSIHDTPVPMNELDVTTNVNFANIDFALVPTEENPNVKKVTLLYNDKYTDNLADTDILPYQEKEDDDEEPAVPDTGAAKAMATFTKAALPIVAIVSLSLLAGVIVFKKRKN